MTDEFTQLLDEGFEKFYYGKWDEAEELYEKARKLRPDNGIPLVMEGRSRLMQGRMMEAREKFLEALKVEPTCVRAYEALASMFGVFGGDHATSLHCLLYALQIEPERQRTWSLLISSLAHFGVSHILKSAVEMASRYATGEDEESYALRCTICRTLGNDEELAREAERFVVIFPANRMAQMYQIMTRRAETKEESGVEDLEEEDPDEGSYWNSVIEEYAESLNVTRDVREEVAHLWQLFLDRKLAVPVV